MSDRLRALHEKRGKLITDARAILDAADAAKRDVTPEERAKVDAMLAEGRQIVGSIKTEEELRDIETAGAKALDILGDPAAVRELKPVEAPGANTGKPETRLRLSFETPERRARRELSAKAIPAFVRFLVGGKDAVGDGEGAKELRALQVDSNTTGGFLVVPEQLVMVLIKAIDNALFVRQYATTFQVPDADTLGAPTLDADPEDWDWTVELGTGTEDDEMSMGKRQLTPHPLAKRIKVSEPLLRKSMFGVEQLVLGRLAYKLGVTQEKAYLTGSGDKRPLGLFTASSLGIPTSRDVSTGNTTTAVSADNAIRTKWSLKQQYWGQARWLMHRDVGLAYALLKDGNGQYIWRQSMREGEPELLLGRPVDFSEYAPNTFTTGQYMALFGDLTNYWIADALNMRMQRLGELYAETNQVGFIGRYEGDGMPVLSEAFARSALA